MNFSQAHRFTARSGLRPRGRRGLAAAGAVLAAALLAGCGSGAAPGVAAVSQGQVIRESDIDQVMADFERAGGAAQIQRAAVVAMLSMRPVLLEVAGQSGGMVGEDAVRASLEQQLPGVSQPTVQFQQTQVVGGNLTRDQLAQFEAAMQRADITLSPAYGSYSAEQGFRASSPNWIEQAPAAQGGE